MCQDCRTLTSFYLSHFLEFLMSLVTLREDTTPHKPQEYSTFTACYKSSRFLTCTAHLSDSPQGTQHQGELMQGCWYLFLWWKINSFSDSQVLYFQLTSMNQKLANLLSCRVYSNPRPNYSTVMVELSIFLLIWSILDEVRSHNG